ncbi:MAG: guanylate kinase [Candidatus Uhrbacteria bacterium]|nr:guanylate kinase [Patescibacteria group bacterium]MBU1907267.1 guanylate kinase [Patescibacteria group bacterium]
MAGKLYVLTGPSAVGKTSVAERLLAEVPNLERVVTYTTREPREGETNGVDYNFVDEATFRKMINAGIMFEWAVVYDHLYGNSKDDIEKMLGEGKNVLLVIDVQGANTVCDKMPDAVSIFISADTENLLSRIKKRGSISATDLEARRGEIDNEIEYSRQCQHVVINEENKLDEAVAQVRQIIG